MHGHKLIIHGHWSSAVVISIRTFCHLCSECTHV